MAQIAQPWRHPQTHAYYLRRQIPEAIRPAFNGRTLFKQSLHTKDHLEAAKRFAKANAELEEAFAKARDRLASTGDAQISEQEICHDLILDYFYGEATDSGLDGRERLTLTLIEADRWMRHCVGGGGIAYGAFTIGNGGSMEQSGASRSFAPPSTADQWTRLNESALAFREELRKLEETEDGRPGVLWSATGLHAKKSGAWQNHRVDFAHRVIEQMSRRNESPVQPIPKGLIDAIIDLLDRAGDAPKTGRKQSHRKVQQVRALLDMGLVDLCTRWKATQKPTAQTAHETEQTVKDFVDFIGDLLIAEITADDILNFRDAVASMPKSMPRADRALPFEQRYAKHADTGTKVSPATVKKRIGGIQALLGFALSERWVAANVSANLPIQNYSKTGGTPRRSFLDSELAALCTAPLFTNPSKWRLVSSGNTDSTAFWLFLLGLTSGARLEEIGQALTSDVKREGGIDYIDIDDYAEDGSQTPHDAQQKSLKTEGSRRVIPIHERLVKLGFLTYVSALKDQGFTQLFPDLALNSVNKRTKTVSQKLNRYINRYVSKDPRLVFHSLRHTFKLKGGTARITDRVLDQLCGHAPVTVGQRYGAGQPLQVLHEDLHKIDFSCVDWDSIGKALASTSWVQVAKKLTGKP